MKVLIVVESHWAGAGGGSIYWAELSRWLMRRGHQVNMLAGVPRGTTSGWGTTVRLVSVRRNLRGRSLPALLSRLSFAVRAVPSVRAYAEQWEPDIIHTVPPVASQAALRAGQATGIPVVASVLSHVETQWRVLERDRLRAALFRRLEHWAIDQPFSRIICLTQHSRRVLLREGIPVERLVYVPHAIDTKRFGPGALPTVRVQLRLARDVFAVGYAGALTPDKGVDRLIRAFARLEQHQGLQLLIAGDGPERGRLQRLVCKLKLRNVRFLGALDYQAMPGFMASLDLYVSPSLTETLPTTVLEALGTGTPVMATGVGGTAGFLQNRLGIVLRDPRVETIAESIDQWLDCRDELRQMGISGQRHVLLEHSWDKTGPLVEDVYQQCLPTALD